MEKKKQLVLIVEDSKLNIKILSNILKGKDYQIEIAHNGEEALQFIENRIPDLILLDVVMPGVDGYEVCRRLKQNNVTKDIPIIFISALNNVDHVLKGFKLGAVDYITKPFQKEEVLARVETHLKLKRAKEKLKEDNKWFRTLFKNATEPIILFDANYRVVDVNKKFEELFKFKLGEIKGLEVDQVMEMGKKMLSTGKQQKSLCRVIMWKLKKHVITNMGNRFNA